MKRLLVITSAAVIFCFGCDNGEDKPAKQETESVKTNQTTENEKDDPGKLEFFDFPNTTLDAAAGQMAFSPDENDFERMRDTTEVSFKGTFSYGIKKLTEVGEYVSKLKDFSEHTIPNSCIIPIPEDAQIKKGDILLASRYGNSMEYAYVTDASNRTDIKANFIEVMPYGSNISVLKKGTYIKLDEIWQPGTYVCVRSHGLIPARIIKVADDKILARVGIGELQVFDKEVCVPVPPSMNITTGDEVYAVWSMAKFKKCTVKSIDYEKGFFTVEFMDFAGEKAVPFGMVVKDIL